MEVPARDAPGDSEDLVVALEIARTSNGEQARVRLVRGQAMRSQTRCSRLRQASDRLPLSSSILQNVRVPLRC